MLAWEPREGGGGGGTQRDRWARGADGVKVIVGEERRSWEMVVEVLVPKIDYLLLSLLELNL